MQLIKKNVKNAITISFLLAQVTLAHALNDTPISAGNNIKQSYQTVSAEYMTGVSDMHGLRLAYRPEKKHYFSPSLLGDFRIEWEISLNLFDLHGSAKNEATYGVSVSPVFIKEVSWFKNYPLLLEAGIGLTYVHEQKFGGVNIGSDYQFEDRLGVLTYITPDRSQLLGVRLIHYSNGGLNTKNPGLDFFSFVYQARF